jgi:SNF2 family DNA or RNA helicase
MEKLLESLGVDVQDENLLQKEIIRQRILNMIEFPSKNYFMIPALSDTSNLPILSNKSSLLLLNELKSELNQYELYSENYNKCYFKYLFFAKLYRENNYPAETITEGEEEDVRRVEVVREVMESKGDSNPRNVRKKNDAEGEGEEWEEEITLPKQLRKKISCEAVKSNEANAKISNANCPLCNQIISIGSYHSIDLAVGQHIDSLCNQNTSKRKRSSRIPPPDPSPPNDRVSQRTRSSVLQNRTQRTTRSSSSRVVSHEADEDEEEEYECEQEDQDEEEEQEEENVSHLRNMNMKFSRVSGAPVRDDWEDDVFYTRLLEYELNLPSVAATATATNEEEPLPVSEDMPIDLSPRHSGHNDQVRSQNLKSRVKEGEIVTSHGSIVEESTWNDLYEYQREGVKWMWELYLSGGGTGGILGDEMGLGKTVQLCTHYSSIANEEISRQRSSPSSASATNMNPQHRPLLLVVCPATVQQHWLQEFHKWAPRLRVVILHSISPTFSALNSMGPAAIKRAINKISQSTDGGIETSSSLTFSTPPSSLTPSLSFPQNPTVWFSLFPTNP